MIIHQQYGADHGRVEYQHQGNCKNASGMQVICYLLEHIRQQHDRTLHSLVGVRPFSQHSVGSATPTLDRCATSALSTSDSAKRYCYSTPQSTLSSLWDPITEINDNKPSWGGIGVTKLGELNEDKGNGSWKVQCKPKTLTRMKKLYMEAVNKHNHHLFFQTVNHARVVWAWVLKPKGIFGEHLNIRSLMPECEEIRTLLVDSNSDFLCLSEA